MKNIASIPGAQLYRTILVVIIVSILLFWFLSYNQSLELKLQKIARDKVIQELNTALSFRLYQAAIKGQLNNLQDYHLKNPFVVLEGDNYMQPLSYRGVKDMAVETNIDGWYFDAKAKQVYYWENRVLQPRYQLQFIYQDLNGSGLFESGYDVIEKFEMIEK